MTYHDVLFDTGPEAVKALALLACWFVVHRSAMRMPIRGGRDLDLAALGFLMLAMAGFLDLADDFQRFPDGLARWIVESLLEKVVLGGGGALLAAWGLTGWASAVLAEEALAERMAGLGRWAGAGTSQMRASENLLKLFDVDGGPNLAVLLDKVHDDDKPILSTAPERRSGTLRLKSGRILKVDSERGFGIAVDITDLQNAKQSAERASVEKSWFVAAASHEIRTPLNAIVGFSELLTDGELNPSQRRMLGAVREAADALMQIIDGFVDLARVEAGKDPVRRLPFLPEEAMLAAVTIVGPLAAVKGIRIETQAEPNDRPLIGDFGKVRQILVGLLSNAIKHGRSLIRISLHRNAGRDAVILVEDDGPGIRPEDRERIFMPFEQATVVTGAGLGLAIARRMAAASGCDIAVVPQPPEQGASFRLTIPDGATVDPDTCPALME